MLDEIKFLNSGMMSTDGEYRHITRTITSTELIIMTGGELSMEVDGQVLTVRRGQVLRILPGELHGGVEYTRHVSFIWMHFDGASPSELPERLTEPTNFDRVVLLARQVLHYAESEGYPEGITECILKALIAEVCYKGDEPGSLVASVKEWIRRRSDRQLRVGEIAESFGYNKDYLNRIFRKATGVGIKQYIDVTRLEAIKRQLLVSGERAEQIGTRCGFEDYKAFLKFFKYHSGMTPGEYREAYYRMYTN